MGEALDIAAATDAFARMLMAPDRPTPGAWWAEREPSLRRLSDEAWQLEVNGDHRRGLLRDQAALLVDGLLAPVARGRGALDLAIGEGLGALSVGDRTLRLGYCSIGDYAREKLGLPSRTAQSMAQLSRELRERPLLREAVLRGEVSASKARTLVRVTFGENEASWVERARAETVRGLREAMRSGRLSYEQARLVAGEATPETLLDWIRRAEGLTVIALRRLIDKDHERQMCARAGRPAGRRGTGSRPGSASWRWPDTSRRPGRGRSRSGARPSGGRGSGTSGARCRAAAGGRPRPTTSSRSPREAPTTRGT